MHLFFNCLSPGLIHPFWKFPMNCFMMGSWWHVQMRSAPTSTVPGSTFPKEYDLLSSCLVSVSKVTAVLFPGDLPNNVWFVFFQGFPVIFHGVPGKDERESNSPSFFNIFEIEIIVDYLKKLLLTQAKKGISRISPRDIGIIAPYRKQVETALGQPIIADKIVMTLLSNLGWSVSSFYFLWGLIL